MTKSTDKYSAAELQKKYSGYKATEDKSASNSSFWLDTKSFQIAPGERTATEYVRLAAYQRAVANFVRIVTGRTNIPVLYSSGNDSYTDSTRVVLSAKLDEKEFDTAVGLALHEGSHIAHTTFDIMRACTALDNYQYRVIAKIKDWHLSNTRYVILDTRVLCDLVNVIEDRRIDRIVFDTAPGYRGYYNAMYKKYFNSKEIDMALSAGLKNDPTKVDDYMFHIINFANPKRNLKVLPALKSIWDRIDILNIGRLPNTAAVLVVAVDVYILIHQAVYNALEANFRAAQKEAEERAAKEESKRRAEELAKKLEQAKESASEEIENDVDSDSEDDTCDVKDADSNGRASQEESNDTESNDIEHEETEDSEYDSENDDDSEAEEDNEKSDEDDSEYDNTSHTDDENTNDAVSEDEDAEDFGDDNLDVPSSRSTDDREEISGTGNTSGSGSPMPDNAPDDSDANEEPSMSPEEQEVLLEKIQKNLDKAIEAQKDFLNGTTNKKKLTATDASKVNVAAASGAEYHSVGGEVITVDGRSYSIPKVDCMIVSGCTTALMESYLLGSQATNPTTARANAIKYNKDYIADGIRLGTQLGKHLKTRDEERSLKSTRLESGRIDKRLIAELGFNNERVFSQSNFFKSKPAHVHISIDASGSMEGLAWKSAMKTAVAIAKAASMTASIEVVISVRGSVGESPLIWTVFDSRVNKIEVVKPLLYGIRATGSTPEGLCFEAIHKQMIADARGKDAYFINMSDGMPSFATSNKRNRFEYHGALAIAHTKHQINKLRKAGIAVSSYYISQSPNQHELERFKQMYGSDALAIDVNTLSVLAKSLNQLFERTV